MFQLELTAELLAWRIALFQIVRYSHLPESAQWVICQLPIQVRFANISSLFSPE